MADRVQAEQRAEAFVEALLATEPIGVEDGAGMQVLKDVPDLYSGEKSTIILRTVTLPFWDECIKTAEKGYRVCAVGSPGIGKSTTFPILLKMLLKKEKTVVYVNRQRKKWVIIINSFPDEMMPTNWKWRQL